MCNKNLIKFNKYKVIRFNYCQAAAKNSDFLFAISILCNTCRDKPTRPKPAVAIPLRSLQTPVIRNACERRRATGVN